MTSHKGAPPVDADGTPMFDPHGHHGTVYQKGRPEDDAIVREGQDILWDEGIDPLFGNETLGHAPNSVPGQHTTAELESNVGRLNKLQKEGGDYNDFAETTREFSETAAARKPSPEGLQKAAESAERKEAKKAAKATQKSSQESASPESASSASTSSNSVSPQLSPSTPPSQKSRKSRK